jgi:hypothetical protein
MLIKYSVENWFFPVRVDGFNLALHGLLKKKLWVRYQKKPQLKVISPVERYGLSRIRTGELRRVRATS